LQGSSAGGWLAASVLLQQPSWFAAAVLTVPCLDPLGLLLRKRDGELELGPAAADAQVRSCAETAVYGLFPIQPGEHQVVCVVCLGSCKHNRTEAGM
jgi:alpha-beta hydrolase superfamily lysophospholipase